MYAMAEGCLPSLEDLSYNHHVLQPLSCASTIMCLSCAYHVLQPLSCAPQYLQSVYEPGKRHWLKVKKDYLQGGAMADTADLVVLGAYYGTGNKGDVLTHDDAICPRL